MKSTGKRGILDAFENGIYSLNEFKQRKNKADIVIRKIKDELKLLKIEASHNFEETLKQKYNLIVDFLENINENNLSNIEKNNQY